MTLASLPIHSASPCLVTFSDIPGWAQKEVAGSQMSGLAVWSSVGLQLSLKLPIWWFEMASEYHFPGRKCPHVCQGIHWWWIKGSLTHCGKAQLPQAP